MKIHLYWLFVFINLFFCNCNSGNEVRNDHAITDTATLRKVPFPNNFDLSDSEKSFRWINKVFGIGDIKDGNVMEIRILEDAVDLQGRLIVIKDSANIQSASFIVYKMLREGGYKMPLTELHFKKLNSIVPKSGWNDFLKQISNSNLFKLPIESGDRFDTDLVFRIETLKDGAYNLKTYSEDYLFSSKANGVEQLNKAVQYIYDELNIDSATKVLRKNM